MIICRDCINYRAYENLEYGNCFHDLQDKTGAHDSCIHAERADGLVECCATCKYNREPILVATGLNSCIKHEFRFMRETPQDKMLCPEWAPREENNG